MQRTLTAQEQRILFLNVTHKTSGSRERWADRAARPMTNAQITQALEYELGIESGGTGPGLPGDGQLPYWHARGKGLKIWCGSPLQAEGPLWQGGATVAMARQVYDIKTPKEFREPSLFDVAQEQQQNASA